MYAYIQAPTNFPYTKGLFFHLPVWSLWIGLNSICAAKVPWVPRNMDRKRNGVSKDFALEAQDTKRNNLDNRCAYLFGFDSTSHHLSNKSTNHAISWWFNLCLVISKIKYVRGWHEKQWENLCPLRWTGCTKRSEGNQIALKRKWLPILLSFPLPIEGL